MKRLAFTLLAAFVVLAGCDRDSEIDVEYDPQVEARKNALATPAPEDPWPPAEEAGPARAAVGVGFDEKGDPGLFSPGSDKDLAEGRLPDPEPATWKETFEALQEACSRAPRKVLPPSEKYAWAEYHSRGNPPARLILRWVEPIRKCKFFLGDRPCFLEEEGLEKARERLAVLVAAGVDACEIDAGGDVPMKWVAAAIRVVRKTGISIEKTWLTGPVGLDEDRLSMVLSGVARKKYWGEEGDSTYFPDVKTVVLVNPLTPFRHVRDFFEEIASFPGLTEILLVEKPGRPIELKFPAFPRPFYDDDKLRERDDGVFLKKDDEQDEGTPPPVEDAAARGGEKDLLDSEAEASEPTSIGGEAGAAYGGRFGGKRNLRDEGGGRHTESGVLMGLIWLKNHQGSFGTWSCKDFNLNCKKGYCDGDGSGEHDLGVTGLALLAFLGAGHTHRHGKFKNTVKDAVKALKERQTPDGCFCPKTQDGSWIFDHVLCAYAASEAYGLTKSLLLKEMAQKGIDFLAGCQNPGMGWRYGIRPRGSDTAVTAWAALALWSARVSGLTVPQENFDGALKWFDSVTDETTYRSGYLSPGDAGAPYRVNGGLFCRNEAMTAASTLSRLLLRGASAAQSPEVLGGGNLLKENLPMWDVKAGTIDMHYWHFGTLAMFQLGGSHWKAWNESMKNTLVPTQRRQGCENGSWDPVGAWGQRGGRVYATAINTLTLETYYRYARVTGAK